MADPDLYCLPTEYGGATPTFENAILAAWKRNNDRVVISGFLFFSFLFFSFLFFSFLSLVLTESKKQKQQHKITFSFLCLGCFEEEVTYVYCSAQLWVVGQSEFLFSIVSRPHRFPILGTQPGFSFSFFFYLSLVLFSSFLLTIHIGSLTYDQGRGAVSAFIDGEPHRPCGDYYTGLCMKEEREETQSFSKFSLSHSML